ncbi:hypothetical protein JBE04_43025 [Streptomyces sp. PRKS01-29]|nr:hypothetical protein [Streptomyces sabulosicollis]MBI0301042.1 hypothetical protein [Streptomyces sabulosicollis]
MATDQEPEIAEDGVQEVPLTIARPLLTRLIEQAREDDLVSALTVRGRRRAYLVTPEFHDQAVKDRAFVKRLEAATRKLTPAQQEALGSDLVRMMFPS